MDKYELAVIVDATIPQEQKESIMKEVAEAVTKTGGKVINSQLWIDKHKFSFRMKKCWEGTYHLVNFESPRSSVVQIRQLLRMNERILRFLMLKAEA